MCQFKMMYGETGYGHRDTDTFNCEKTELNQDLYKKNSKIITP